MILNKSFASPNYDDRPNNKIDYIIIHYTEMNFDDALQRLCEPLAKVSCHYLIKENGEVFQLVKDKKRAWHAGNSYWAERENINDCSIGIELDNLGNAPFKEKQIESCITLCKNLITKHNIDPKNILGHSDIAPQRKVDPGIYFDWHRLAQNGLGIWPKEIKEIEQHSCANIQKALYKIGYNIEISNEWDEQMTGIARAFQYHFCQEYIFQIGEDAYNNAPPKKRWNQESTNILFTLIKQLYI